MKPVKFHIVLTENDADIIAFKNFVPRGKFNDCVINILRCAVQGKVAEIPMRFDIDVLVQRSHTKIDLPEDLVRKCYKKLGFESGRFTTRVKAEIRKAINKNRKSPPCSYMTVNEVKDLFQATETIIKTLHIASSLDLEQPQRILTGYYTLLDSLIVLTEKDGEMKRIYDEP